VWTIKAITTSSHPMPLLSRFTRGLSILTAAAAMLVAQPALAEQPVQPTHYGVEPSHMAAHDGNIHKAVAKRAKPKAKAAKSTKPVKASKPAATAAAKPTTHTASKHPSAHSQHATRKATAGSKRDARGKIARSTQQKNVFKKSHPCPSTGKSTGSCPGYVVDHKVALKRGGADMPQNMQWQTKQAAKAKDKVE
jgi:hypothetical protein